jgi:hypothetical protein
MRSSAPEMALDARLSRMHADCCQRWNSATALMLPPRRALSYPSVSADPASCHRIIALLMDDTAAEKKTFPTASTVQSVAHTLMTANAIPLSTTFPPTRNILWRHHFNLWSFHSYPELPLALGKSSQRSPYRPGTAVRIVHVAS